VRASSDAARSDRAVHLRAADKRRITVLASELLQAICERQGSTRNQLTVHSDNSSPMKGETMLATMQRLGVVGSRSRPAVSNDNPYSKALFRTLKYRPQMPVKPFGGLLQALR
jgi:putative transposase